MATQHAPNKMAGGTIMPIAITTVQPAKPAALFETAIAALMAYKTSWTTQHPTATIAVRMNNERKRNCGREILTANQ